MRAAVVSLPVRRHYGKIVTLYLASYRGVTMSTDELVAKRKRAAAASSAKASVRLEGFVVSKESEALEQRYIDGDIGIRQWVEALNALYPSGRADATMQQIEADFTHVAITEIYVEE